jgi:hypothetical protein
MAKSQGEIMAPFKNRVSDIGTGGPGKIIYIWLYESGSHEISYEQRKVKYRAIFNASTAKIFFMEDQLKKDVKHWEVITTAINEVEPLLDQADNDYRASYEGHQTHDTAENNYTILLGIIDRLLWVIVVNANLIEAVIDDDPVTMHR